MDLLTEQIISAAIDVHRILGPELLESIYEEALCYEFSLKSMKLKRALLINFGESRLVDGIKRISL